MVIHTIGFCRSGQWNHGGWMNTYIFPGAELPTMSLGWEKGWLFCYWTCQMLNHILSCTERTCVAHWGHTSRNSSRICWKSLDLMSCCGGRVGFLVQGWVTVKMLARVLQDDWLKILTLTDWSLGFPSAPKAWRYWWVFISYVHTYTLSTVRFMAMCYCRWFFQEQWHLEDWQSFGVSYAKTLRAWKDNLNNWQGLEEFDQSFRRMWVLLSAISNARQVHVVLGCGATHHHTILPHASDGILFSEFENHCIVHPHQLVAQLRSTTSCVVLLPSKPGVQSFGSVLAQKGLLSGTDLKIVCSP